MQDGLDTSRDYVGNFVDQVVNGLPEFLGALLILLIGYFVAKALEAVVRKALESARLNDQLYGSKGGNIIQRVVPNPTALLAKVTYWVVFLFAVSIAVSVLGIPVLVEFVRAVYAYLPNILAALIIFLVASAVSAGVVTLVTNAMGDTPTGKMVATAAPLLIMGLAVFMILNQLQIAPEIVTLTYAALVGSVSLGLALAFGLGGRDVAGRILENMYETGRRHKGTVARDTKHGAEEARRKVREAQDQV